MRCFHCLNQVVYKNNNFKLLTVFVLNASAALSSTVVLRLLFCWVSCAIMSFGVRWISSGCMASFTQVSTFNLFRILPLWWLVLFGKSAWCSRLLQWFQHFPQMIAKAGILMVECFVGANKMSSSDNYKLFAIPRLLLHLFEDRTLDL